MRLFLLIWVALATNVNVAAQVCPDDYSNMGGKCYKYNDVSFPSELAATICGNTPGGELLTIKSIEEEMLVEDFMLSVGQLLTEIWLGIYDKEDDGMFKYLDGSFVMEYSYNGFGGPQNPATGNGCATRDKMPTGATIWKAVDCNIHVATFVCTVPLSEPPPTCAKGWKHNTVDGTCLRVIKDRQLNYAGASAYCKRLGAELATKVTTIAQRRRIMRLKRFRAHLFIGIDDVDNDGAYTDKKGVNIGDKDNAVNGLVPGLHNGWASNAAPFKKRGGIGPGKCITLKNRRWWYPKSCYKKLFFVCEKDAI